MSRTWGAAVQKIVAARQGWTCNSCGELLPACYQVDHITPLWDGGEDCHETNAQALCPNCHAGKTQKEDIRRRQEQRSATWEIIKEKRDELQLDTPRNPPQKKIRNKQNRENSAQVVDKSNPFIAYAYIKATPPKPPCNEKANFKNKTHSKIQK